MLLLSSWLNALHLPPSSFTWQCTERWLMECHQCVVKGWSRLMGKKHQPVPFHVVIVWRRAHILAEMMSCFSGFPRSGIEGWDLYPRLKGTSRKEPVYYLGQLPAFHLTSSTRPEACSVRLLPSLWMWICSSSSHLHLCFSLFAGTASYGIDQMAGRSVVCY